MKFLYKTKGNEYLLTHSISLAFHFYSKIKDIERKLQVFILLKNRSKNSKHKFSKLKLVSTN